MYIHVQDCLSWIGNYTHFSFHIVRHRDNTIHVTFSHSPIVLGVTGLRHSRLVKDWQRKRSMLQWSSTGSLGLLPGTSFIGYAEDWEKGPSIFPTAKSLEGSICPCETQPIRSSYSALIMAARGPRSDSDSMAPDELRSLMPWLMTDIHDMMTWWHPLTDLIFLFQSILSFWHGCIIDDQCICIHLFVDFEACREKDLASARCYFDQVPLERVGLGGFVVVDPEILTVVLAAFGKYNMPTWTVNLTCEASKHLSERFYWLKTWS